ncbi:glycosyl hydrolase [Flavilitoribacter nigricans]|uniref:Glycoside hydrolase family 2 protein n=1 Tax=Flavilitoribacter nigricans (strain ATCC 23147 / DSM 23189 / NBRC 102662 / NCIMB 1420 / SS-2) TaxID=1122177 RepID=A0A2D0N4Z3_FLAN2|nr:glycosyl hydrolase [Flavilitoribacter nigricans]PHN03229.1 glycoside hydrolase family 2 protein [Flavilitoribacter nigricans DSM 23189 = NBRC 102662]
MIPTKKYFLITAILVACLFTGWLACTTATELPEGTEPDWPEITQTAKPWTRWWWHGSAVNKTDLSRELEAYQQAGLGGVELTPIFGVIGREDEFLNYLSPEWMDMFNHSLQETQRLDMGMDMATGTGWPFGGPWVGADDAPKYVTHKTYTLSGGQRLREAITYTQEPVLRAVRNQLYQLYGILLKEGEKPTGSMENPVQINTDDRLRIEDLVEPVAANENLQALALDQVRFEKPLPLQSLMAYSKAGEIEDLTDRLDAQGQLDWTAPAGEWTLYAVFQGWHGKMVERAAPGGEGNTLDHFSEPAIRNYLSRFDSAFANQDIIGLRAFFNDSYEVDDARGNADWTPRFFEEFETRRDYDLRDHLPALFGDAPDEKEIVRVNMDFQETLSDLLLETFTQSWHDWAHDQQSIIRNQAHGSPSNILDLYAASDIPETEGAELLMIKFASSAAHVAGRQLVSSESATWLNEHFLSSLADIRRNLERYFLGGVNHVFYHGTTYSPEDEAWPGRLFYAAVHLNPRNSLWKDFGALNTYAARVQSFLQDGRPANDVLLYFPIYDRFAEQEPGAIEHFHGKEAGFTASNMRANAATMQENGFTYDYISDRQIRELENAGNTLTSGGLSYQTIVIPETEYMPLETFEKLTVLAENGATVIVHRQLPETVPGLGTLEEREQALADLKARLDFNTANGVETATLGAGLFLRGDNLEALLLAAGVQRENMTDEGLQFTRRSHADGHHYFIANWTQQPINSWVTLGVPAGSAYLFDAVSGAKGVAETRTNQNGDLEVRLQLGPDQSLILKSFSTEVGGKPYPYLTPNGNAQVLGGPWTITFAAGGPELPASTRIGALGPWTDQEGAAFRNFSGTAVYQTNFSRPESADGTNGWILDLGKVAVSARVTLNGEDLGTRIGPDYRIVVPAEKIRQENTLEVAVSNLMANRIAELDRQETLYKKFYNVNFPARLQENRSENGLFTAAGWEPLPSGLLGPVRLLPVTIAE